MSYPKLYRDFLENEGAGPLLRADRMPVIETAGIADGAVTEAKLSQSYLPTTGGTITGSFKINDGTDTFTQLTRTPDNGVFLENVKDGKVLNRFVLRNPDRATRGGYFELDANDGTNKSTLTGTPSGALSWNAKPVITLVDSWHSGSSWYRKYSDGWVEQGGKLNPSSVSSAFVKITLFMSFSGASYVALTTNTGNYVADTGTSHAYANEKAGLINKATITSTSFDVFFQKTGNPTFWCACGY